MTIRQDDQDGPPVWFVELILLIIGLLLGFTLGLCIGLLF